MENEDQTEEDPEDQAAGNTKPTRQTDVEADKGDEVDGSESEGDRAEAPNGNSKEKYPGPE